MVLKPGIKNALRILVCLLFVALVCGIILTQVAVNQTFNNRLIKVETEVKKPVVVVLPTATPSAALKPTAAVKYVAPTLKK